MYLIYLVTVINICMSMHLQNRNSYGLFRDLWSTYQIAHNNKIKYIFWHWLSIGWIWKNWTCCFQMEYLLILGKNTIVPQPIKWSMSWMRCIPYIIKLCDKVCQWLATGRWFSPVPPVSSTNKAYRHKIPDIFLKVALNTIALTLTQYIHKV
jgi:hypothetical protein